MIIPQIKLITGINIPSVKRLNYCDSKNAHFTLDFLYAYYNRRTSTIKEKNQTILLSYGCFYILFSPVAPKNVLNSITYISIFTMTFLHCLYIENDLLHIQYD